MTTTIPVLCDACKRRIDKRTCTSFPAGIPEDIVASGADHRKTRAGEPPFSKAETPQADEAYEDWRYRQRELIP